MPLIHRIETWLLLWLLQTFCQLVHICQVRTPCTCLLRSFEMSRSGLLDLYHSLEHILTSYIRSRWGILWHVLVFYFSLLFMRMYISGYAEEL